MKYVNADTIFPKELLEEIQKYINGVWFISLSLKNHM